VSGASPASACFTRVWQQNTESSGASPPCCATAAGACARDSGSFMLPLNAITLTMRPQCMRAASLHQGAHSEPAPAAATHACSGCICARTRAASSGPPGAVRRKRSRRGVARSFPAQPQRARVRQPPPRPQQRAGPAPRPGSGRLSGAPPPAPRTPAAGHSSSSRARVPADAARASAHGSKQLTARPERTGRRQIAPGCAAGPPPAAVPAAFPAAAAQRWPASSRRCSLTSPCPALTGDLCTLHAAPARGAESACAEYSRRLR
jgi:hypothetical protein